MAFRNACQCGGNQARVRSVPRPTVVAKPVRPKNMSIRVKVNPNEDHPLYVDPVVWGKTVAPLATPFQANKDIPGPSGTAIPTFTLMDIFFGRTGFATTVGHETRPHPRLVPAALASVPESRRANLRARLRR